jgi:hypothetical protein
LQNEVAGRDSAFLDPFREGRVSRGVANTQELRREMKEWMCLRQGLNRSVDHEGADSSLCQVRFKCDGCGNARLETGNDSLEVVWHEIAAIPVATDPDQWMVRHDRPHEREKVRQARIRSDRKSLGASSTKTQRALFEECKDQLQYADGVIACGFHLDDSMSV